MRGLELSDRESTILKAVIEAYVASAKPVSSSEVVAGSAVTLSSATVRNVMRALEEKGLILQPHTSAGRVPTDLGYRYYVDNLIKPSGLTASERRDVGDELSRLLDSDLAVVLAGVSHIMSELSRELAVAVASSEGRQRIRYEGARYTFSHPEFVSDASSLGEIFDSEETLAGAVSGPVGYSTVRVVIGGENRRPGMEHMSLIAGTCRIRGSLGRMGIIGPTRMRYARLMGLVEDMSRTLDELFADDQA